MPWLLLLLFVLGSPPVARAAEPPLRDSQYQLDEWTPASGFPEETVLSIYRPPNGYLWLGTALGILRFDGQGLETALPTDRGAQVWSVSTNRRGEILCTVTDRGVYRIVNGELKMLYPRPLRTDPRPVLALTTDGHSLLVDGDEVLIEEDGRLVRWQKLPEPAIGAAELAPGVWALATRQRLIVARGEGKPWESYAFEATYRAMAPDGAGGLYIGTTDGLLHFGRSAAAGLDTLERRRLLSGVEIHALAAGAAGELWAGGEQGLLRVTGGKASAFPLRSRLPGASIGTLAYDGEGNLWGSYIRGGLFRLRRPRFPNWEAAEGLRQAVRAILHDGQGGVWAGDYQSIHHIAADGAIRAVAGPWNGFQLEHLLADGPGALLALGMTGLRRIDTATLTSQPVPLPPSDSLWRVLFRTRAGQLWIANDAGEFYVRGPSGWRRRPLSGAPRLNITAMMAETIDGRLWLSVRGGGLYRVTESAAVPIAAGQPERAMIYAIYADEANDLWVGTQGAGVGLLDGDRLRLFAVDDLPQRNDAFFLAEDAAANLWLGLRAGLLRVPKAELRAHLLGRRRHVPLRRYTIDGGLPSGNFGVASDRTHPVPSAELWLPHMHGVMRVDPARLMASAPPPEVHIDAITADGVPLPFDAGQVRIPPECQRLAIRYSAPYFQDTAQVRFTYQLLGLPGAPVGPEPVREAVFTSLPPGKYTLQVRAINADGVWTPSPATLAMEILPAFYQTWPFRIGVAVSAVALLAALGDWRLRRLRREKARLEAHILERTHQLRRQRERAEEAAKAKSDFLAVMSHEIRTPLHGVLGTLELLGASRLEGEEQEYVATARRSGESLLELLNNVLDLSRLEAGQMELHAEEFSLEDLLASLIETFRYAAAIKGLTLDWSTAGPLPTVAGDRARLRQILNNLVGNAVKFTDHGSITLAAAAAPAGPGEIELTVTIRDTGIGIPPERLEALFEPFTQGDASSTRRHSGTGLGLAIARRLALEMGGTLTVESAPGRGSEFCLKVVLPVAAGGEPAAPGEPEDRPLHGRILLVEDNRVNQMVATRLLEQLGCSVDIAVDGLDGIERAARAPYDLILMDCQMPRLTGIEATRRIRSEPGPNRYSPVIALTANSTAEDRQECLAAGMDGFLSKPFSTRQLRDAIAGFLEPPAKTHGAAAN